MLNRKLKPSDNDLFKVPFSCAIKWSEFKSIYPNITHEMNGECKENCLLFYYEKNIVNQVYEFRDNETELDMSEILGIDINVTIDGESIQEKEIRTTKSCNDIAELLKNITHEDEYAIVKNNTENDLSSLEKKNYKKIKEDIKLAKKERRQQKILEKNKKDEPLVI